MYFGVRDDARGQFPCTSALATTHGERCLRVPWRWRPRTAEATSLYCGASDDARVQFPRTLALAMARGSEFPCTLALATTRGWQFSSTLALATMHGVVVVVEW